MTNKNVLDEYLARIDRLPTWGLSYVILYAIGFSYFITLYDAVGNIGAALPYIPFLNASTASLIASIGLFGYIPGSLGLGYLADRIGRKPVLILTVTLTAIGSLGMALSVNFPMLAVFRFIEGAGIGGDLNLAMVYVTEFAPSAKRGKYANYIYLSGWIAVGVGATIASVLVTSLPGIGWRLAFGIAAIMAFAALVLRVAAPETVRFLVKKGKIDEAEKLVRSMEETAMARAKVSSLPEPKIIQYNTPTKTWSVLGNRTFLKRLVGLVIFWFFIYFVQYTFSTLWDYYGLALGITGSTFNQYVLYTGFAALGDTAMAFLLLAFIEKTDRRLITQIGSFGWLIGTIVAAYFVTRFDLLGMALTLGFILNAIGGGMSYLAGYLMSSESFPTSARSTGFAISDGLGHIGGAIGPLLLFPLVASFGPITAWGLEAFPVVIAAVILWFTVPKTVGVRLEEINENLLSPPQMAKSKSTESKERGTS
ncbi:MFS transporter [Sulfolobus acidocaldarius]|uniref:MFS transporter n=3 Tax=Sulfolobus acidocaldarius TaxID=2285 RepID=A0A0U3FCF6_9CREN|nr:MFS transporter [Sulfolobus acidocaldarius]AGE71637.1 sugar-proton symporter [Sulfolobus acidocaldarius N8]AGE73911.1 sugar-proton symporter [Sulfolobus acidocaldarius Ron12/I]ALU30148.1 MFS transporter [Sulfolobus acidocaldarius]ALU30842.1 MFS transporter [Sulfolobus acidocaldarius]WCM35539.1 MFS transporter [Sulfolobus acidocaldarius DSM 639]